MSVTLLQDSDAETRDVSPTLGRSDPNKPFRISANVQLSKLREVSAPKCLLFPKMVSSLSTGCTSHL